jgi:predicted ATPase
VLKKLVLENYRCFGEPTTIPCAPITVMFGKNSAGKSSIISSLLLLKQSVFSGDDEMLLRPKTERGPVDLGSTRELMFGHDLSLPLRIAMACEVDPSNRSYGAVTAYPGRLMRRRPETPATYEYGWTFSSANATNELALTGLYAAKQQVFRAAFTAQAVDDEELRTCFRTTVDDLWMSEDTKRLAGTLLRDHAKEIQVRLANQELPLETTQRMLWRLRRFSDNPLEHSAEAAALLNGIEANASRLQDVEYCEHLYYEDQARSTLACDGLFPSDRYIQNAFPRLYDLLAFHTLGSEQHRQGSRVFRSVHNGMVDITAETALAARATHHALRSLVSIGPVRERPSRLYIFSGTTPTEVGHDGRRVPDLLFRDAELLQRANDWLTRLEVPYQIVPQQLVAAGSGIPSEGTGVFELRLRDSMNPDGPLVSMSDVGFGVSQILPIIAQILLSRNNLITVEQPELHIHPGLQARLADLFIAGTQPPHSHQFLIETHSEHFALRLQKRLAEKDRLKPEDVNFLFVRRTGDGSKVVHIPLDGEGHLTGKPPGGFFLDRLSEL